MKMKDSKQISRDQIAAMLADFEKKNGKITYAKAMEIPVNRKAA